MPKPFFFVNLKYFDGNVCKTLIGPKQSEEKYFIGFRSQCDLWGIYFVQLPKTVAHMYIEISRIFFMNVLVYGWNMFKFGQKFEGNWNLSEKIQWLGGNAYFLKILTQLSVNV